MVEVCVFFMWFAKEASRKGGGCERKRPEKGIAMHMLENGVQWSSKCLCGSVGVTWECCTLVRCILRERKRHDSAEDHFSTD